MISVIAVIGPQFALKEPGRLNNLVLTAKLPDFSLHPFLHGLDAESIDVLISCAENRHYSAGEYLWRQGETADALYLILDGKVNLEIQVPTLGPLVIDSVGKGESLGWSWHVPPGQSPSLAHDWVSRAPPKHSQSA